MVRNVVVLWGAWGLIFHEALAARPSASRDRGPKSLAVPRFWMNGHVQELVLARLDSKPTGLARLRQSGLFCLKYFLFTFLLNLKPEKMRIGNIVFVIFESII